MKRVLSIFMIFTFIFCVLPFNLVLANDDGTTYYVDYSKGNDNYNGKSKQKPWKTLERVNSEEFEPGDKILFKAGETWDGILNPKGSGEEDSPITIDMYGGGVKPRFIGQEDAPHVFYLYNEEYWEINNLDISADYDSSLERRGVHIKAEDKGIMNHIYLNGLDIHNVEINLKYPHSNAFKTSGGIFVEIKGNSVPTKFDDLKIENCTIENVDRTGIQLLWSSWSNRGGINTGSGRWYPSTNIVVKNNLIKSTAGDGIVIQGTDGAIVEHNIIDDFAARNQGVAYNCAAWSHNADNTVFRYNTGLNGNTTMDGMPWDSDGYSNGTIFEYNYSKNNEGGAYLAISYGEGASPTGLADSRDSIFRYNISENDRFALMTMTNPVGNHKVYNNVFYVGPEREVDAFFYGNMSHKDIGVNLSNNIFYVDKNNESSGKLNGNWAEKFKYDSNIYYSKEEGAITKLPKDSNKVLEDPMFLAPGTGEEGYKVSDGSPAINSGRYIVDNGGKDYYGNKLYNGKPDIGVHEYNTSSEEGVKSIKKANTNLVLNGDFEEKINIDSIPEKNLWYSNINGVGEINNGYSNSGSYGLMVKNHKSGGTFVNYQPILKENTRYELSYDAKKVAGNPRPIQIKWFNPDSSLNNGYDGGVGAQLSDIWKSYSFEFSTGESFTSNEPPMIFIASTPNGEIWVDNVKLIELGATDPDGGDVEEEKVDLTEVKKLLVEAKDILKVSESGDEHGEISEYAFNSLKKSVTVGEEVLLYENRGVNKQAEDDIEILLKRAIDGATRSKINENTGDIDGIKGVDVRDLAYGVKFMGAQVDLFNENWDEAKVMDLDGDNRVDFEDIMNISEIIIDSNEKEYNLDDSEGKEYINEGETFEVVYEVKNLNGLVAQDLSLVYDSEVLELISFDTTIGYKDGSIESGVKKNYHSFLNEEDDEGNRIILSVDNHQNALIGDIPLIKFKFKAADDGCTNIVVYDKNVDLLGNINHSTTILKEGIYVEELDD